MTIVIQTLINALLLIILGFVIKNYLPSYFHEKGKNLATKEDISDITKIVEQVKNEFISETELLKTKLQFQSSQKQLLLNEERNVLLYFYEQVTCWQHLCQDLTSATSYFDNDIQRIRSYQMKLNSVSFNSYTALARVKLFIDEAKINELALQLLLELNSLNTSAGKCLINHEYCYRKIDLLEEENKTEKNDEIAKILDEMTSYTEKHRQYLKENNIKIMEIDNKFAKEAKAYIYKNIED